VETYTAIFSNVTKTCRNKLKRMTNGTRGKQKQDTKLRKGARGEYQTALERKLKQGCYSTSPNNSENKNVQNKVAES